MTPMLGAVLAYLALQLAIGVWVSRRVRDEAGYLVAGRSLGPLLATFSIFATWFGAETIVGSAGTAYREGVSLGHAEPFGYGLCLIVMGLVFARPLWRRGLTTLADLFRVRYGPGVERVAALVLVPGSVLWAAAQIAAFGQVVASVSTLGVGSGMLLAAGFVVVYTTMGGMLADAWTDLVQGGVLVLAVLGVGVALLVTADGAAVGQSLVPAPAALPPLALLEEWLIPVFGSVVAVELVQRVISARSGAVARGAAIGAGGLYLAIGVVPLLVGAAGARLGVVVDDPEQVMAVLSRTLLPDAAFIIFAGALISAILSTVDSILLVAAGLVSHNLIVPALGVTDERVKVRLARGGVLLFGLVAWMLARRADGVYALVEQASAFGSAGALTAVTFGLFTRWGGRLAAYGALLGGVGSYVAGLLAGVAYPFLLSLLVAPLAYGVGAAIDGGKAVRR